MSTTTIDPHPLLEDLEASSMKSSFITKSKSYMGSVMEYAPSTHLWQKILIGGTLFDAFMMESAQQVGQSLLNLPRIFAKMGYAWGIVGVVGISILCMWCQFLLVSLLAEYEHIVATNKNHPRHGDKNFIASYHDVMYELAGKWWGRLSLLVVFLALIGLGVGQVVSTTSNLYILTQALPKRTLTLIIGAIFSLTALIPNYRDYRLLSFIGLCSTFYTACYIVAASASRGPIENVEYTAPTSVYGFFTAFTNIIFMYGSHTAVIEKAVKMNNPELYDRAYYFTTIYVNAIALPSGITGYHSFGITAADHGNALTLFESSPAQSAAAILMCIHEFVAYGLFVGSLYHVWEKLLGIEAKAFWIRVLARYLVAGVILLVSVAMPFFGVINSVIGAFVTTLGTYVLPAIIYNLHFNSEERRNHPRKELWFNWKVSTGKILNRFLIVFMLVFGFAIGGWASMKALLDQVHEFHLFPECWQC